jgi:hypothetical protein
MKTKMILLSIAGMLLTATITNAQYAVCLQAEDATIPEGSDWKKSTAIEGFGGTGYLEWWGGDTFVTPAVEKNILTYTFSVPADGDYTVFVRGRRDFNKCGCPGNAPDDACNDIFVKIDDDRWIKTLIKGPFGVWAWDLNFEKVHKKVEKSKFTLTAGEHKLYIAGRSAGVMFDAIKIGLYSQDRPTGIPNCQQK